MKKTGAWLARYALEQLPISHTFGIPGVHNTELYDELNASEIIQPVLVTHEGCGAFMADGMSRVSDKIGCLLIVPAAGVTHAASGIGEAFLDGIPMLIISGGIRSDSQYGYQLHEMDQHKLLEPITKKTFKVESHDMVVPTIFEAYAIAVDGEPGPVFVEIPVNIQLDRGEAINLPEFVKTRHEYSIDQIAVDQAIALFDAAKSPGIFVGWGAVDATENIRQIAEHLGAPVATTLQGISSFPADHPLHTGFGFGPASVPASKIAFDGCDCLLAIGTRFGEIATGSYGVTVPKNLIHIDINPKVFNRNYPARVSLQGDAKEITRILLDKLHFAVPKRDCHALEKQIAEDKKSYRISWQESDKDDVVNPVRFFDELRMLIDDDSIVVVDDGNHTFLTAELLPIHQPKGMISPTDFNCMGYAVPAAIGAKIAQPEKQVVSIVGDGAFLMTAMELATASKNEIATINFIFSDGELSQISQAQQKSYNRTTCTELVSVKIKGIAMATGAEYLTINNNTEIAAAISKALELAEQNKPVIVDVNIDYSRPTSFTNGVVKTNIKRLPFDTKVRMIGRAVYRKVLKK
ncbi:thiamine pyrophosphate-binding protein [Aliikangiella coralliicola]|uniref:Thiamine pyrophosphate-binding protein n=1 Tax=Aliikangiella coralliicola TaxID=2592383 RepID=A0A545TWH3_9GAMM|nr:thiamine pyrophosphate-binding protein [Aliikangiella coralliicola]TQV81566.1 thiamine pyrophosphate-binding protein [Aliikangiella coralliicola]